MMIIALFRNCLAFVFFGLVLSRLAVAGVGSVGAVSSGVGDQVGLSVTIYNADLGLVKDQRALNISSGVKELRFMDVASQIIPASVSIRSLSDPGSLVVLEQNYEYDLLNPQKLMDKYVGKTVKLYLKNLYTEREEVANAQLLSNNNGPIYRIGDEITFGHPGRVIFPEVPDSLISKPTLVWLVDNRLASGQTVEASYLANGITWRADYVVTLNERDDAADLMGWVTIDNRSGAAYKDASIKLVAGDINRVKGEQGLRDKGMRVSEAKTMAAAQFKEEEFFEYHIYSLQRKTLIKENQTKQIGFVGADGVSVRKELVFYGAQYYYRSSYGERIPNQKVSVFVEFANKKEANMGMPLPKGTVRVYKRDGDGSLQFVGEDLIEHTPKDENVRVKVGEAFDVVGSRKQVDWKKIAYDTYEAAFEVSIRNHKKEDVVVKVIEPVPGEWAVVNSSHGYKKTEAFTAEFMVPVGKDGEAKLAYRVRMRF